MRNLSKKHWLKIAFFMTVLSSGGCFAAHTVRQYGVFVWIFLVFSVSLVSWVNLAEKRNQKIQ